MEIRGDKELGELPIAEKVIDEAKINYWREQIKIMYPKCDEALLNQILDAYSTHPHIISDLAEEHRKGLHHTDAVDRPNETVFNDSIQIIKC
jgi:hypothetical protein